MSHFTHMVLTLVGFDGPSVADFDRPFPTTLAIVLVVVAVAVVATWLILRRARSSKRQSP